MPKQAKKRAVKKTAPRKTKRSSTKQIQKVNVQVQSSGGSGGGGSSMPTPSYIPQAFRDTAGEAKRFEGILDTIKSIEKERKSQMDAIQQQLKERKEPSRAEIATLTADDNMEEEILQPIAKAAAEPERIVENIFNKPDVNNKSLFEQVIGGNSNSNTTPAPYMESEEPKRAIFSGSSYEDVRGNPLPNFDKMVGRELIKHMKDNGIPGYSGKTVEQLRRKVKEHYGY